VGNKQISVMPEKIGSASKHRPENYEGRRLPHTLDAKWG